MHTLQCCVPDATLLPAGLEAENLSLGDGAAWDGVQIDGVQIRTPVGFVDCRVHIKGGGWLGWVRFGSKYNSGANGYAGIYGSAIDAIQME